MQPFSLPVHLIRQHIFCPRIPYFLEVLGIRPDVPLWVAQGKGYHDRQERLSKNRTLKRFGFDSAARQFRVNLESSALGLHGIADAVLETADRIYPVEFKTELAETGRGQVLQLLAYGLMAEEKYGKTFEQGFLLYGEKGRTRKVIRHPKNEAALRKTVAALRANLTTPRMPESPASVHQCGQCEFFNYCNDRF